jgi:hypothetical protein
MGEDVQGSGHRVFLTGAVRSITFDSARVMKGMFVQKS